MEKNVQFVYSMPHYRTAAEHPQLKKYFMRLDLASVPFDKNDKDVLAYFRRLNVSGPVENYNSTPRGHVAEYADGTRVNNPDTTVVLDLRMDEMVVSKGSNGLIISTLQNSRDELARVGKEQQWVMLHALATMLCSPKPNKAAREAIDRFEKEYGIIVMQDKAVAEHLVTLSPKDAYAYLQKIVRNLDLLIEVVKKARGSPRHGGRAGKASKRA